MKIRCALILFFVTVLHACLDIHFLCAQQQTETPQSADAATIEKKITLEARRELDYEPGPVQIAEPLEEKIPPPTEVERSFFIKHIVLQGNESIRTENLVPFLTPYENREVTLTQARVLAEILESEYRRRGYVTTIVYIPPQRIEEEILRIEVVEGKMGKFQVEGNRWFSQKDILRYARLRKGEVLRYEALAKNVRRMNENPDREVQAIMRPGEETGYTDIYIKVKDHFPLHAGFSYDNQGVESTGRRRYGFNVRHNNWLLPDSVMLTGTSFGKDFGAIYYQYLIPITPFGTQFISGFSHAQVSPKKEFKGADINGISQTYNLDLRQIVIEKEKFTLNGHTGFDFKESHTKNTGGTSRLDRLRVIRPGFQMNFLDRWGATRFSNEFSFGLNGLGATDVNNPFAGRQGADPDFFKYEGTLTRTIAMPFETQVLLNLNVQLSPGKLVPQEGLYLGGANSVRGYPEGDYLADQGILFTFEYQFSPFFIPDNLRLPHSQNPLKKDIQLVLFTDEAYGRLRGVNVDTEVRDRYLIGIGGGVRIRLYKNLYARIEWAHALGQEPLTESDHSRLHFQLQMDV